MKTAERNFIKSPSGSSHSEPIQSQCSDSWGVTFKKVGYEVPLLITNNCKRQVLITKAKYSWLQSLLYYITNILYVNDFKAKKD